MLQIRQRAGTWERAIGLQVGQPSGVIVFPATRGVLSWLCHVSSLFDCDCSMCFLVHFVVYDFLRFSGWLGVSPILFRQSFTSSFNVLFFLTTLVCLFLLVTSHLLVLVYQFIIWSTIIWSLILYRMELLYRHPSFVIRQSFFIYFTTQFTVLCFLISL